MEAMKEETKGFGDLESIPFLTALTRNSTEIDFVDVPHPNGHYHGEYVISLFDKLNNSIHATKLVSEEAFFRKHAKLYRELISLYDTIHINNCHIAIIQELDLILAGASSDNINYDQLNAEYLKKIQDQIELEVNDYKIRLPLGNMDFDLFAPAEQTDHEKVRVVSKEYRDIKLQRHRTRLELQFQLYSKYMIRPDNIDMIRALLKNRLAEYYKPTEMTNDIFIERQIKFDDILKKFNRDYLSPGLNKIKTAREDFSESLLKLCQDGNYCDVDLLLFRDSEVDVEQKDSEGATALHYAARHNRPRLVRLLLEHKASPNVRDQFGYTPLHYALRRTLYKNNFNRHENDDCINTIDTLIEFGADPEARADNNRTPLQTTCVYGCYPGAVWLLGREIDIQTPEIISGMGRLSSIKSPLLLAVENGHYDLIVTLLEKGAAPMISSKSFGPMYFAITQCRIDIAIKLMEYGIFLNDHDSAELNHIFLSPSDTYSQELCLRFVIKAWYIRSGLCQKYLIPQMLDISLQDVIKEMLKLHPPQRQRGQVNTSSFTRYSLSLFNVKSQRASPKVENSSPHNNNEDIERLIKFE